MTRSFDDLVDTDGLSPAERARLERVHDLLVAAGPPAELPADLATAPAARAEVVDLSSRRSRRAAFAGLIAAALAAAAFGAGYLVGDRGEGESALRVVQLQGGTASGSVRVMPAESGGNWPIELKIDGLPRHAAQRGYYELFVWRKGKPGYPCVGFKMQSDGTTTIRFTVPYELKKGTQLVVTSIEPGKVRWPGQVVMRTA
jgi:hypothetical protein